MFKYHKYSIRIAFSLIFSLLAFSGLATSLQAQTSEKATVQSPPLTLLWQSAFDKDSAMIEPDYIAVDSAGNSYIGDLSFGVVKKFDADGKFSMTIHLDSMDVTGVGVDSQGNLLVAAFDRRRVLKFDPSGQYVTDFVAGPSYRPITLAIDPQDNVYLVAWSGEPEPYIRKFDPSGTLVTGWGSFDGTGDGEFGDGNSGAMLTVDADGNVYATDPGSNRIQKFDSDGKILAKFELPDDGKPIDHKLVFDGDPFGVAVDGQGNIYVSSSHFLRKLDAEGNILAQWPTTEGDLYRAGRVAVDEEGNIYIVAEADVTTADNKPFKALVLKKFQQP